MSTDVTRPRRYAVVPVAILCGAVLVGCGSGGDTAARPSGPASSAAAPAAAPASSTTTTPAAERSTVEVLDRFVHDDTAFTQGLLFDAEGRLFEGLGLEGRSALREVDPATGEVLRERRLADDEFGEGIAIGPDGFVQLTWQNGLARRWSDDLDDLGAFEYEGEGWGLTFDGTHFLQTDGSDALVRRDAGTFEEVSRVRVTRDGEPVDQLNELEWVDGSVLANVWHSDELLRIDPATGRVTEVIDASSLWVSPARDSEMTLNGIAHRPGDDPDVLWLTGKNWPELFRVRVVAR